MTSRRIIVALLLAGGGSSGLGAEEGATPAARPTMPDPSIVPIAFADDPIVRASVGHDEPFLEGRLAYGYGGRVTTDVRQGKRVMVPAGSPAYGIPMVSSAGAGMQLVWCAIPTPPKEQLTNVCLVGSTLSGSANDTLLTTGLYAQKYGPDVTGGAIEPAPFNLGAPIRVAYYIQNLGKITRIKGEVWVGTIKANQWGLVWGSVLGPKSAEEKLIAVGGGLIGVKPDPAVKGHYTTRVIKPLHPGGSAVLQEARAAPLTP